MAPRRSRPRQFLLPTLLAAILAAEVTGLALARTLATPEAALPAPAPAATSAAAAASSIGVDRRVAGAGAAHDLAVTSSGDRRIRSHDVPVHSPAVDLASASGSTLKTPGSGASTAGFHGTNRVWIPSLGVNKGIQSFPCSRTRPPDAGVYRWGCSGRNNVYLLSHAWSTFEPLHDAYVSGRLRKGMKVAYADASSRVRTYSVIWWRVTAPTTAASWAWASLGTPSMTLQTCVGSQSQYRLMVRLVQVG